MKKIEVIIVVLAVIAAITVAVMAEAGLREELATVSAQSRSSVIEFSKAEKEGSVGSFASGLFKNNPASLYIGYQLGFFFHEVVGHQKVAEEKSVELYWTANPLWGVSPHWWPLTGDQQKLAAIASAGVIAEANVNNIVLRQNKGKLSLIELGIIGRNIYNSFDYIRLDQTNAKDGGWGDYQMLRYTGGKTAATVLQAAGATASVVTLARVAYQVVNDKPLKMPFEVDMRLPQRGGGALLVLSFQL